MPRTSHPPRLDYSNYTWRRVQITKLLVIQYSLQLLFSNTLILCPSLKVRDQVSHPNRTTGKNTVLWQHYKINPSPPPPHYHGNIRRNSVWVARRQAHQALHAEVGPPHYKPRTGARTHNSCLLGALRLRGQEVPLLAPGCHPNSPSGSLLWCAARVYCSLWLGSRILNANQVYLTSSNWRKFSEKLIYGAKALSYKPEGRGSETQMTLLFLPSSSSIVLTRLSGLRSRPTTSQKIW
jgi:hypothetical protein